MPVESIQIGSYTGAWYREAGADIADLGWLASIRERVAADTAHAPPRRHAVVRHIARLGGHDVALAIKSFSRDSWWRDRAFLRSGSKAARSFRIATHLVERGVGTPKPLAYLDRWENGRLLESYYLCQYQDDITNFRDELNRLYARDPLCRRIMTLMETVAAEIARMHAAGVCHYDLGNQNILLRRIDADTWGNVQFIDLNRARIHDRITMQLRARDISRLDLPSDFLRVFKCMYFGHRHPGHRFEKWEGQYRRRFARHTATRSWRHPIRERRIRRAEAATGTRPLTGRELWIWDDRSVQAVSTLLSKDRHAYYPFVNHFYIARGLARSAWPVHGFYRELLAKAFSRAVDLTGRIGMAAGTDPGITDQERALLAQSGVGPVLLRLYRHADPEWQARTLDDARRLKAEGRTVWLALVQDRACIREPRRWTAFLEKWLPAFAGAADWLEVGHAVNRVKWGIWDVREYRALAREAVRVARAAGRFQLAGPAVIDFEYHYLAGLLDMLSGDQPFDALSHHLYVDRRGAPENRQGRFSILEKCALAKAMAAQSPAVKSDRLVISEVNWPLLDTGVYSPVCSPYVIPNSHTNDPSVDEETYANFMVRYYLLTLCSGLVETVYWWRLVARGFGLVDDRSEPWRPRPAYAALQEMTSRLGDAAFVEKMAAPEGVWLLRFRQRDGHQLVVAWSHPRPVTLPAPFRFAAVSDRDGKEIKMAGEAIMLGASPVYFHEVQTR